MLERVECVCAGEGGVCVLKSGVCVCVCVCVCEEWSVCVCVCVCEVWSVCV